MEKSRMGAAITANVEATKEHKQRFLAESVWDVEHWRGDKLLSKDQSHNVCTTEGLNKLLNVMFGGAGSGNTQVTTWYICLFEDNYTPLITNTYATPGYNELAAASFTEAARVAFVESNSSAKSTTNSASKASFAITATKTIYGAALVGGGTDPTLCEDTAGGGTLYCSSQFSSSKAVESGDTLKVQITITAADV